MGMTQGRTLLSVLVGLVALLVGGGPAAAATPTTIRVSVNTASAQANKSSGTQLVAAGGRIVVFASAATNLVPNDSNGAADVFLRNTALGTTVRVSVSGTEGQARSPSFPVAVSEDGRFVLFNSRASNLAPGDTNGGQDAFLRDRGRGTTIRMKRSDGSQFPYGAEGMDVSDDGRYVTLVTARRGQLFVRLRDRTRQTAVLLEKDTSRCCAVIAGAQLSSTPLIASSGPFRIRVFDATGAIRSSIDMPSCDSFIDAARISGNGRYVAFVCNSINDGADAYVYDRTTLAATPLADTATTDTPRVCGLSNDGHYVAVISADALIPADANGQPDVYMVNRITHSMDRVSLRVDGSEIPLGAVCQNPATGSSLSSDGGAIGFTSSDPTVILSDTNGVNDVFLRSPLT
jgi:Tol biopolymer transport system component